jgi:hypothetical protein
MRANSFMVVIVGIISTLVSCSDDETSPCTDPTNPKCPNFDPCLIFEPANADFVIIDSIYGTNCFDGRGRLDLVFEVDTTYASNELYFRALHPADSYSWQIGTDSAIYTAKKFSVYFPLHVAPANIDVTLVACKADTNNCQSKLCDTLVKRMHLLYSVGEDTTSSLAIGKFKGVDTNAPLDTFIIEIPPPLPTLRGIINFPNGCTGQYLDVIVGRNGFIVETTPTVCQSACGIGHIQADRKTLIIDYSIQSGNQRILKQFVGTKI